MRKFFVIETPPYPFSIAVSIGQTKRDFNTSIKTLGNYNLNDIIEFFSCSHMGQTCNNEGDNLVIVMLKADANHGVIAHELFHAVTFVMSKVGINLHSLSEDKNNSTEEAYAYMIEYITNKFYDKIEETAL
jgi:hypothetical protein